MAGLEAEKHLKRYKESSESVIGEESEEVERIGNLS